MSGRPGISDRAAHAVVVVVVLPFVGLVAASLGMALFICGLLVWMDLLQVNPNRTSSDVLTMVLLSPFYGLVLGIALFGWAIAVGGLLTGLATLVWRLPSATGMAVVAVASTLSFVRWCYSVARAVAESSDWRQSSPPWLTLVGGATMLTASLYAGWWAAGRLDPGARPDEV